MALYGRTESITYKAAADLRTKQYHVMRQSSAGICNVASNPGGGQAQVIGVLENKPNTDQHAAVVVRGEMIVVAGGTVTAGSRVAPNGSGRVIDAVSGDYTLGVAQEAATTDGEKIRVLVQIPSVRLTF